MRSVSIYSSPSRVIVHFRFKYHAICAADAEDDPAADLWQQKSMSSVMPEALSSVMRFGASAEKPRVVY